MSIDQQFVEFVVKSLVSKPDEVKIERRIDEKGVLLELTVDPEDLGRVIGKRGATAQSLRTLLRALGTKNDARYNLKIVDNGVEPPKRERREDREESPQTTEDSQEVASESSSKTEDDAWSVSNTTDEASEESEEENDTLAKTRKELADLDDLEL